MKVLVTGASGFIGRNLVVQLRERGHASLAILRGSGEDQLWSAVQVADAVVHLAGVNRPDRDEEFIFGNSDFTRLLCEMLASRQSPVPVLASSTIQVDRDNAYGKSKREAELHLERLGRKRGWAINICRLANVFGKWCRPNYNSVVATYCHNITRGLPIRIDNSSAELRLVYIDDVVDAWLKWLESPVPGVVHTNINPEYHVKLGDLAELLRSYAEVRTGSPIGSTASGFGRALYATYLSYVPKEAFDFPLVRHEDTRGVFVEMLRTSDSGQFSFFTAGPGVTRGGHYHHTKTEKFLIVSGRARFRFRNVATDERHELFVSAAESRVVETVPGWSHDVTNVGTEDLICLLWANESFDRERPDTIASPI